PLVLVQESMAGLLPPHSRLTGTGHAGALEKGGGLLGASRGDAGPETPACVIFTSGSTRRPKGAMNRHRSIVKPLLWAHASCGLTPAAGVLQKTPLSFDVSAWELFWTLVSGACLVLARPGGPREPAYLARTLAEREITLVHFVPAMLQSFLTEPGI